MELEYFVLQINESVKTFVMIYVMIYDKNNKKLFVEEQVLNPATFEQNRNLWSIALYTFISIVAGTQILCTVGTRLIA